jgi:ABC-type uncharacterized transport system ATPase component
MIYMSYIEIRGVTKTFINANKEETQVLKGIDLDIKKATFMASSASQAPANPR